MGFLSQRSVSMKDGTPFVIRCAEEGDAEAALEFLGHIAATANEFNVMLMGEPAKTVEAEREWLRENRVNPAQIALLAVHEGRIVGLTNFRGQDRLRVAHHGHFGISVHAAYRERGVGAAMITALLDWARVHPVIEKVCLGVFATNTRAIHLYTKMGFREDSRREKEFKFGPGRYVDDVQMSQWVKRPGHDCAGRGAYGV